LERYIPGSSLSGRRSSNGPSPAFGAATNVLLAIACLPLKALYLGKALARSNRGSIVYVVCAEVSRLNSLGKRIFGRRAAEILPTDARPRGRGDEATRLRSLPASHFISFSTTQQPDGKMEQTSARPRKPFQYKADGDSDDSMPEALDEEGLSAIPLPDTLSPTSPVCHSHPPKPVASKKLTPTLEQDSLIRTLNTQNETRNTQYKTAFTAFCLLCNLPYLVTFYSPSTSAQASLLSILSITSLLSSAYTLYSLPSSTTGFPALDAFWAKKPAPAAASKHNDDQRETAARLPQLGDRVDKSPLELYLPGLNLVLVGLISVIGVLLGSGVDGGDLGTLYALLPAGVLGLVVVVKLEMGSVDVGELEGLRYGYKGA
jgi:hypothetical protein